jgi:dihydrolipoamide dehydrogenase
MFDLLVLGGGPAGYLAAERAGRAGMSVCCFEMRELGGVCLNEGCIPSKTLLNSAKIFDHAANGKNFGVIAGGIRLDHSGVQKRRAKVVRTLVAGVKGKLKASNVTVIKERAVLCGFTEGGFTLEAGGQTREGRRLLIATGSSPVIPPIPGVKDGIESGFVVTNREALTFETVPKRLVVIGGGVVGLELALYYRTAGSEVTVIEALDHIAGSVDREFGELLLKECRSKGMDFLLNARVTGIENGVVTLEQAEKIAAIPAEKVLLAVGRRANTSEIGLETIGIETGANGIVTDAQGRTNVQHCYAAGDVNGVSMLAHTAYREAEVCVNTMLGKRDTMRYHTIPAVIYTQPEVAWVGLTEEAARAEGVPYECKKLSMRYSGRFIAENDGDGLCKILIHSVHRNLLGVHMIGSYASEVIWGATAMLEAELRVTDAKEIVFPHPTVSEILREVLWEFND